MPDLAAAERFWVDVMGYAVEWRPDPENVYLSSGSDNLALHGRPVAQAVPAGDAGGGGGGGHDGGDEARQRLDHIGLAVPAPEHVDAWAAHLSALGVPLDAAPRTHRDGSRSLYLRAPGDTTVQIIYHRPLSK